MAIEYPDTMQEFIDRFSTEASCLDYIATVRWGGSFQCPTCSHKESWRHAKGVFRCKKCRRDVRATADTVFDGAKIPLRTWFLALWLVVSQKNGASALGLARVLGFSRYETAWLLLGKMRGAMIRPHRERLSGTVEVDEVFLGGVKPGKRGRGALGKVLVLVAVEDKGKKGFGRIRISIIKDARAPTLIEAIRGMVEHGSTIRTDRWAGYPAVKKYGYDHVAIDRESIVGEDPTPLVHRIASLVKRWLLGTHHGRVEETHLAGYLNEYVFRFNRRTSRSRGKLFYRLMENMVLPQK